MIRHRPVPHQPITAATKETASSSVIAAPRLLAVDS
jgi:hypothetical protein